MQMGSKALIIGSSGQIGTELVLKLREIKGKENVIASDIRKGSYEVMESGPFEFLDVTHKNDIREAIEKHQVREVYLMVAILSVIAEKNPKKAWELNMNALFNVLAECLDRLGARELYEAYKKHGITLEDFEGPRYQRIGHIRKLLDNGILDETFRFKQDKS